MEFTQLQYFLAAARCQRITQAAEELHVSQSTISMAISRLEEELGMRLFDRGGRSITLTEAGRAFMARIDDAVFALEDAASAASADIQEPEHAVRLFADTPGPVLALEEAYLAEAPEQELSQSYGTGEEACDRLLAGELDLALTLSPLQGRGLACRLLYTEPAGVLLGSGHPLARRASLSLSELGDTEFIAASPRYALRAWSNALCARAGFIPWVRLKSCDTASTLLLLTGRPEAAALCGMTSAAGSLAALSLARSPVAPRLIPLTDDDASLSVYLTCPAQREADTPAARLLDWLDRRYPPQP